MPSLDAVHLEDAMPEIEIVADAEEDHSPYFFFSYARKDLDPYLKRFFKDLVTKVENLAAREGVSFRDLEDMEPGDNWPETLATALQKSRVLVALYSVWYFERPYCGKEFQVFLDRVRVKGTTEKIIPLLWHSKDWLSGNKLPPSSVAHIHYEHKDFPPQYLERGLNLMAQNRNWLYKQFLDICAKRIVDLARKDPLPPYDKVPDLRRILNAFDTPGAGGEPVVVAAQGPRRIHLLFVGAPKRDVGLSEGRTPWNWTPFVADPPQDILSLIEGALDRNSGFEGTALESISRDLLMDVRSKNSLPILVIDHSFLGNSEGRRALVSIIDDTQIDCGFLVILSEEANASESRTEWLQFGQRNKAKSLAFAGSGREFQESLSRIVNELRQRTVEYSSVHRPVEGEGPSEKPLLRGPGKVG
jgi:TIR domain